MAARFRTGWVSLARHRGEYIAQQQYKHLLLLGENQNGVFSGQVSNYSKSLISCLKWTTSCKRSAVLTRFDMHFISDWLLLLAPPLFMQDSILILTFGGGKGLQPLDSRLQYVQDSSDN